MALTNYILKRIAVDRKIENNDEIVKKFVAEDVVEI